MTDKTIGDLTAAGALDGAELVHVVQGGDSVKATVAEIVTLNTGTAQASTSGTVVEFTGVPSWAKRVTVMLSGVSTNGTSIVLVQVGDGSFVTTGYTSIWSLAAGGNVVTSGSSTAGFVVSGNAGAADLRTGLIFLVKTSGNLWTLAGDVGVFTNITSSVGSISLTGALDRVRLNTVNGTDTFDAGSVNILWE